MNERELILNKYDKHCAYCGCLLTLKTMQVDHVKPIMRTKLYIGNNKYKDTGCMFPQYDTFENKVPACRLCNYHKHTFTLEEFRSEIQEKVNRVKNSNVRLLMQFNLLMENPDLTVKFYFEKARDER